MELKLWDATTGEEVLPYLAEDEITALAWSDQGDIAVGTMVGTIVLLRLENLPLGAPPATGWRGRLARWFALPGRRSRSHFS